MGQWVDQKQSIELSQISREKKGDANELRLWPRTSHWVTCIPSCNIDHYLFPTYLERFGKKIVCLSFEKIKNPNPKPLDHTSDYISGTLSRKFIP
jgi:hypothetical protein